MVQIKAVIYAEQRQETGGCQDAINVSDCDVQSGNKNEMIL